MGMNVGFTGSQKGMTSWQSESVKKILNSLSGEFHHGDCVGADVEAAMLAREGSFLVVGHPCTIDTKRAYFKNDETRPVKPPLERNHDIVDESFVLIAAPGGYSETLRSGTWSTVRYARSLKRKIVIVWPDGKVVYEGS